MHCYYVSVKCPHRLTRLNTWSQLVALFVKVLELLRGYGLIGENGLLGVGPEEFFDSFRYVYNAL